MTTGRAEFDKETYRRTISARAAAIKPDAANVVTLSDVTPERIQWLWEGRLAMGKLTLLCGDPGLGKSTIALDIAARLTTGRPMPLESLVQKPAHVLLLTAEDGLADTVRPRFDRAQGDPQRLHVVESIGAKCDAVSLPEHIGELETAIRQCEARLLIVDPFMAYLSGGVDSYRDQDVRRALAPLAMLAADTSCALLLVRHPTKALGGRAITKGGGSIGITAAARVEMIVGRDPDDETGDRRVLAIVKCNIAPHAKSLAWRLEAGDSEQPCVDWQGDSPHKADALVRDDPEAAAGERDARDVALSVLEAGEGEAEVRVIQAALADAGVPSSSRTLSRIRHDINAKYEKDGFAGKGRWVLPGRRHSGHPRSCDRLGENGEARSTQSSAPETDVHSGQATEGGTAASGLTGMEADLLGPGQQGASLYADPNDPAHQAAARGDWSLLLRRNGGPAR